MASEGGNGLTLPTTQPHGSPTEKSSSSSSMGNPFRRRKGHHADDSKGVAAPKGDRWWKIHLFRGMINDIRRRAPYYWSDWRDAWNYRVVPATIYMYFANIMPALAFSLDMFTKTNQQFGVNEVLLSSVLGAVVFAVLACQPLVIVGVTGPITVFNYTVYDIITPTGTNYLAFMCWIGIWSLILHWILAITNSCNWLRYVTRFPCDIFGFYVAFIYLQKGIQVLERFGNDSAFYLSVMVALLVFMFAYACGELGGKSALFWHPVRVFIKDYGTPLTVIFFTGFIHFGRMDQISLEKLPTSAPFFPTANRGWFIHFWDISVSDVFLALPFAILLTVLFWFDHNVSSLIAQGTEFPLRKPAGFHWDLFLLGLTTGVAGLLGLPFPNGLIPQAPFHTESLCVTKVERIGADDDEDENEGGDGAATREEDDGKKYAYKPTHVVEQRVSNLAQGLLTLGTMSGPLLVVLHLIPQAVLAGLFFIMGYQALEGNGVTVKLLFLLRDQSLTPASHPLRRLLDRQVDGRSRRRRGLVVIWSFVALELVGFAATFAITQTIAAVGFPLIIMALIPVRAALLPRLFDPVELAALDEPTASPFTMESVGGAFGGGGGNADDAMGASTGVASGDRKDGGGALLGRRSGHGDADDVDRAEFGEAGGLSEKKEGERGHAQAADGSGLSNRRAQGKSSDRDD